MPGTEPTLTQYKTSQEGTVRTVSTFSKEVCAILVLNAVTEHSTDWVARSKMTSRAV